jgi:hypothetical protein
MKYLLILTSFSILFFNCNSSNNEKEQNNAFSLSPVAEHLYSVVGEKHDTAMLLMKDIGNARHTLRNSLNEQVDSLQKLKILDLLLALKKADDAMMNWMREFKNTDLDEDMYKSMSEAEIVNYLSNEEVKIEAVQQQMLKSIAQAKN